MYKCFVYSMVLLLFSKPLLPLAEYYWNYDYIVKELCQEKEKDTSDCKGSCYLKNLLASASEQQLPLTESKITVFNEILFCELLPSFQFQIHEIELNALEDTYSSLYFLWNSTSVFHPPIIA